jgi:hypothetical protein
VIGIVPIVYALSLRGSTTGTSAAASSIQFVELLPPAHCNSTCLVRSSISRCSSCPHLQRWGLKPLHDCGQKEYVDICSVSNLILGSLMLLSTLACCSLAPAFLLLKSPMPLSLWNVGFLCASWDPDSPHPTPSGSGI